MSNPDLTLLALVMNGGRNATNILYNKFLNQPNINLNDYKRINEEYGTRQNDLGNVYYL